MIKILKKKNYLAIINHSVDTKLFTKLYIGDGKNVKEILENGNLSCAYFVTCILKIFDLIKTPHTTVSGTQKDLEESGWKKIKTRKTGCLLLWEKKYR